GIAARVPGPGREIATGKGDRGRAGAQRRRQLGRRGERQGNLAQFEIVGVFEVVGRGIKDGGTRLLGQRSPGIDSRPARTIAAAVEGGFIEQALPRAVIERQRRPERAAQAPFRREHRPLRRSEEHTSELQSPYDLVCRLLLEKKKLTNHQKSS